ncbi:MAG: cob(I)yrinic acid a,c-diamide adenosyltransferase [Verrucomicrobiota bacterium]|nr:cob(I)yrinic acid a,c-diamide adenosyltransferase [Verrucomicrobiota bacterium]
MKTGPPFLFIDAARSETRYLAVSIATKTGDSGETSLMYGRRVHKSDPRVDSYGCVDELNAALGLARVIAGNGLIADELLASQKELILVMGELATAPEDLERYTRDGYHVTMPSMVDRLTAVINDLEKDKLLHYKGWAIPGSTLISAALDVARTTCRRAERRVAVLGEQQAGLNPEILRYLNRLSDLCWLLARYAEHVKPQDGAPAGLS